MAASKSELLDLHSLVARTLAHKMTVRDVQRVVTVKGEDKIVEETLEPTAAEISVAVAFLKNNDIITPPDEGSALDELRKIMEGRRKARPPVLPDVHAGLPDGMH